MLVTLQHWEIKKWKGEATCLAVKERFNCCNYLILRRSNVQTRQDILLQLQNILNHENLRPQLQINHEKIGPDLKIVILVNKIQDGKYENIIK